MKINNDKYYELPKILKKELKKQRKKRNFKPKKYIKNKVKILKEFFKENNLKNCVIGISGGIDSAVVLGILKKIKSINVQPVILPSFTDGVSDQLKSQNFAIKVCKSLGYNNYILYDMKNIVNTITSDINNLMLLEKDSWAKGQLISNIRIPILNYISTRLGQSIIVGTTNKDEGSYIGYFGKYSDAMVDIQPITDLHKSEVIQIAKKLKIPKEIINRKPQGDIWNKKTDEEMFGCSYDYLEFYLNYLNYNKKKQKKFKKYIKAKENLENLHKYNLHKYKVCSQALHFDLFDSFIKNGWKYKIYKK